MNNSFSEQQKFSYKAQSGNYNEQDVSEAITRHIQRKSQKTSQNQSQSIVQTAYRTTENLEIKGQNDMYDSRYRSSNLQQSRLSTKEVIQKYQGRSGTQYEYYEQQQVQTVQQPKSNIQLGYEQQRDSLIVQNDYQQEQKVKSERMIKQSQEIDYYKDDVKYQQQILVENEDHTPIQDTDYVACSLI